MRRRTQRGRWAWFALACTGGVQASGDGLHGDWPTHVVTGDGTDLGVSVLYQYDLNRFSHDGGRFDDAATNRRKYLGFYVRKPGVYDANVQYDFQARQWMDTFVRVRARGAFGVDLGAFRLGYTKTPVGFEGVTSSAATTFIETALPTQAFWEGRRTGLDWTWVRPTYLLNLGYYFVHRDLDGNNPGHTVAARAAWVPLQREGYVLHLGVSASRETPDWHEGTPPSARLRARPEDGLSPVRLVDTGALAYAGRIERRGAEALWIDGPFSAQGEYLSARVSRTGGRSGFEGHGAYLFATWTLTGEAHVYTDGNVADRRYYSRDLRPIRPRHVWGALELALRYSRVDLDDGSILGGRERNWTLGLNWYLGEHLKLQADYVRASGTRRGVRVDPHMLETRAQLVF